MNLKTFIANFNFENPSWNKLPDGWPKCRLTGLGSKDISQFLSIKTLWKIQKPKLSESRSRVWESTKGHRFLIPWSNAMMLRILVRKFTTTLPRSEQRTKTQLDDAARSIISNIEEGFKRPTTSEYLQFLGYSQASLEEVHGLVNQNLQDKFMKSMPGSGIQNFGLDLKIWNTWARDPLKSSKILEFPLGEFKGIYRNLREVNQVFPLKSSKLPYPPLNSLNPNPRTLEELPGAALTYEQFIELCNKTDYLLRQLVSSLEIKLIKDKKYYQVEQSRIKSNLKFR